MHRDGRIDFKVEALHPAFQPFADAINANAEANNQNRIARSPGLRPRRSPTGTSLPSKPSSSSGGSPAPVWPFKIYNTTSGSTGKVKINGGDGALAALGGAVATIAGNRTDTAPYPNMEITGNGCVFAKFYVTVNPFNNGIAVTSVEIGFADSVPGGDGSTPPAFGTVLIATITNYAVDGAGNVRFTVNDANAGTGITTVVYCGGSLTVF